MASRHEKGLAAARRLMEKRTPAPDHALQVCRLSLELFDQLVDLHRLGRSERRLLEAAALLHDIGQSIDFPLHHKHARDLILRAKLPGFDPEERAVIACVARYHRKGHPQPGHKVYRDLPSDAQRVAASLAALIRIADGLDRSQSSCTTAVHVSRDRSGVHIRVEQQVPNDVDIWAANRKRGLFEEVFELPVDIQPSRTAVSKTAEPERKPRSKPRPR